MRIFLFAIAIICLFTPVQNCTARIMPVTHLQCEHMNEPLGIDAPQPRFTWQLAADINPEKQVAFELIIAADEKVLKTDAAWRSGKIYSTSNLAIYTGDRLKPFTRYFWTIHVYTDSNKCYQPPAPGTFETGMCGVAQWHGAWISDSRDKEQKAAPAFRKTFTVSKKIIAARAYIAAAGLYELYINGNKTGDHILDPMYTRFDRRNLYVTYDVTAQLHNGANTIGVLLGNGWYNHQSLAVWEFDKAPWRARPAFCMDLRITYEDGTTETIATDRSWKTKQSAVIFNSIYTGEHYDARREQQGWSTSLFNDSGWENIIYRSSPSPQIVSQVMPPVREVKRITPQSMHRFSATDFVFDLGQNIAGVSQLTVSGSKGTVIRLKHAEQLTPDGHADQANIDVHYRGNNDSDPFQTDIFILAGNGTEVFKPRFNYKGFRYVEVTADKPLSLSGQSLTGCVMHSDVTPVGSISSTDTVLELIWKATNNSYLSNLFGYPTDCPQREKNGWTGDAHIASETGLYNFDAITVYEKWLADHRDEQQPNGVLPSIIPSNGWGYEWGNGPDWTSTIAIIPWNIYLFYGDSRPLSECYDNIKKYVDHITDISPSGLTDWGLGDWVPVKSKTPVKFTSSIYYYTDVTILAKAAKILGKTEDYLKYGRLAQTIKSAFNEQYLDRRTGIYADGNQTELSTALYWHLVPDDMITTVAANLARRVIQDNFHLDVGLLGTKSILNALSENGYADIAYKVAAQKTYPSWGWWIVNGATTLYENWDINAHADLSKNHIMFGEIGAWLYKGPGGIHPDEEQPGFKNIILSPGFPDSLKSFTAIHSGPYGKIVSSWKREGKTIKYDVTIPANSTATLHIALAGASLYENGAKADGNADSRIKTISTANGHYTGQLQAGAYHFILR